MLAKFPKTLYDGRVRKVFVFIIFIFLFFFIPVNSFAQGPLVVGDGITVTQDPPTLYKDSQSVTFTFTSVKPFLQNQDYTFAIVKPGGQENAFNKYITLKPNDPSTIKVNLIIDQYSIFNTPGVWSYKLWLGGRHEEFKEVRVVARGQYYTYPCTNALVGCPALGLYQTTFTAYGKADVYIVNAQTDHKYAVWFEGEDKKIYNVAESDMGATFPVNGREFPAAKIQADTGAPSDSKALCLTENISTFFGVQKVFGGCDFRFSNIIISASVIPPISGSPTPIQSNQPGIPTGIPEGPEAPTPSSPLPPCAQWVYSYPTESPKFGSNGQKIEGKDYDNPDFKERKCAKISTGIGDINTDPFDFVKSILSKILSLAGGIAVILIIISGYRLMTSQGNPETVQAARDQLTSAIVGFLFIIFSLVILQVIGVDILHIPGFTK